MSMRQKREMSVRKFEARHPGLVLIEMEYLGGFMGYGVAKTYDGKMFAQRLTSDMPKASRQRLLYDLSEACTWLAGREAMDRADWKDANTGQTGVPLDCHHLQKRSAGRLDSQENLAAVSRATHNGFHGQVEFTKK